MPVNVTDTDLDFSPLHQKVQSYVDDKIIPFALSAVLQGNDVIDLKTYDGMNLEAGDEPVSTSSIFRMHSSTKIACSVGAMMLWEEGRFDLDDPVSKFIPDFADMQVLKTGATDISDVEPAKDEIRIRHILSHTAGLSYGFIEPESTIDKAYNEAGANPFIPGAGMTLESLCTSLGQLPLAYHPGTFWRYSLATDVTARLIEVISGQRFDEFLKARIFTPLGMTDTDFYVPPAKLDRLTSMFAPEDPLDPMSRCAAPMDSRTSTSLDQLPSFLSGGGGLVSTFEDYLAFARMIIGEGQYDQAQILKPETLALMRQNQCARGVIVNFPMWSMPGTTFGLGFALKGQPVEGEPESANGEYHWGGMAGTHFWWSPKAGITGICMTQRMPGFWHPFSHDFKRLAYQIAARG